jgi:transposase InsO family protein
MKTRRRACAIAFLKAAVAYYASLGISVERVMTDNGSCYKAFALRRACKRLGLRHIRTKPYTPRTNGKAERFIQTASRDGPMPKPTIPQNNARSSFPTGCIATTGTDLMAVSDPCRPLAPQLDWE